MGNSRRLEQQKEFKAMPRNLKKPCLKRTGDIGSQEITGLECARPWVQFPALKQEVG